MPTAGADDLLATGDTEKAERLSSHGLSAFSQKNRLYLGKAGANVDKKDPELKVGEVKSRQMFSHHQWIHITRPPRSSLLPNQEKGGRCRQICRTTAHDH